MNAVNEPRFADLHAPLPADRVAAVIERLSRILPAHALLHRAEDTRPFECDALSAFRQQPLAVALPENEEQVCAVLRACRELDVPIVPRGAGTSLSGGSMPHAAGVVLSLSRLSRIVSIDPRERVARVQPGVRNLAISEAAAPHGLYYAPDPSSQIACSIGGNVAENSGGVHCLKYGLTVHNVLGLRAWTIEGELLEIGGASLDSPGLDLLAVLIGSEGMLAVVTEVTVRLLPRPQLARAVLVSFDDVVKAGDAVAAIVAAGIIPAGMEMMDQKTTRAVEPFVKAGYDLEAAAILIVESDGTPEEVAEEIERIRAVLAGCGATAFRVSANESERLAFWSGRKNAFPAAGRISPDYYCMDGTIPRKMIGRMLEDIAAMESRYGLGCMNVFHAGDGNLHPLILFDANDADSWNRAERFGSEILERCVELGGTVTGEHGVGVEKLSSMCVQFSPDERDMFFAVKHAWDPPGLLNPGTGIPTLARCAEYGRVHVHRGMLPHADLPRF